MNKQEKINLIKLEINKLKRYVNKYNDLFALSKLEQLQYEYNKIKG